MVIVAEQNVIDGIRGQGGSVYFWAGRRYCGGTIMLNASVKPPDGNFELVAEEPLEVFARPGARLPSELHLELDRKSRVRAFWDGLAWIV